MQCFLFEIIYKIHISIETRRAQEGVYVEKSMLTEVMKLYQSSKSAPILNADSGLCYLYVPEGIKLETELS